MSYENYYPSDGMMDKLRSQGFKTFGEWYNSTHPEEGYVPLMMFMGNEIINSFMTTDLLYAYCLEHNITWHELLGEDANDIENIEGRRY